MTTLESLDQKLIDLKESVDDLRLDVNAQRTENQTAVANAFNQHALLHTAHQAEHQSADTRFWAAVGLLATGIIAVGGYVAYRNVGPMVGFVGAGALVGAAVLLQHKIGIGLGILAARAAQTNTGRRMFTWYLNRRLK